MELHEAIRRAYAGRYTQADLARALGVDQTTVSSWSRGNSRPTLEQLAALEDACDRPLGFVLRLAGFVEDVVDVPGAVAVDPCLDDLGRDVVLNAYRAYLAAREAQGRQQG